MMTLPPAGAVHPALVLLPEARAIQRLAAVASIVSRAAARRLETQDDVNLAAPGDDHLLSVWPPPETACRRSLHQAANFACKHRFLYNNRIIFFLN